MIGTTSTRRSFLLTLAAAGASAPLLGRAERVEAALAGALGPLRFDGGDAASVLRLRSQYLLSDDLIYLNHASIGTVPTAVVQAHAGYLELCESYPSLYVWGPVWRTVTEQTRSRAAGMLGCEPDDLAITHNTTEGFNILAHGLPLAPGDEILFSSLNHAGASVAWEGMAEARGFTVRSFDFPVERVPEMTVEEVVALHAEAVGPATRAVILPHVDNQVGMNHPVRAITDAVRARGVEFVLVDGAQSAGMTSFSLRELGVDAYAMSPHKWLQAPKGLGLLWVAPHLRERLPRMWFKTRGERVESSARKYEDYSTRAWPAVVALGDALSFQEALGSEEKTRRYERIQEGVLARTDEDRRLVWRSPHDPALRTVIMAVEVRGAAAPDVALRLLDETGVDLRAFGGALNALRVSPNAMTTDQELERFLDAATGMAG